MDSHDVAAARDTTYFSVLRSIRVPALIATISSDVLYPPNLQLELSRGMANAQHHVIESDEGHDGFLIEHQKLGTLIRGFLEDLNFLTDPLRRDAEQPQIL